MNDSKNISYSQMDMYIKDIQKLSKSIKPFFDNPKLKDPFINSLASTSRILASLSDNPRVHPGLKDEQRFIKQQFITSKLENDPIFHLKDNVLDKKYFYSYMQNMQTILNTTGQDPLNGILSDINTSKKIIPEILSNLNISVINDCIQDICDDTDEAINTNFEETAINILENLQAGVEEYNSSPDIPVKVKVPFRKTNAGENLQYFLGLLVAIVTILSLSGYNIRQDFLEPFITHIANIKIITDTEESKQ